MSVSSGTDRSPGGDAAPSFAGSVLPLLLAAIAVAGWLSPPDPFSQLLWAVGGLLVAVGGAYWFAGSGHARLAATGADLWLFTYVFLGVLILVVTLVPNPAPSALLRGVVAVVAGVLAGVVAFRVGSEAVRERLPWTTGGANGPGRDGPRGPQP